MPFALSGGPGDAAAQLIAHLQCAGMLDAGDVQVQCPAGSGEALEKGMHDVAWHEACDQAVRLQTRRVYCCQCLLFMPRIHNCQTGKGRPKPCTSLCERVGCRETSMSDECASLSDSLPSPPVTPPICS